MVYQLQLPPSWKIHNVFHASYLSQYRETKEHGPNYLKPPPDIIEGQPEWEVEAIVGMRLHGRKKEKQYRVHWKEYSDAQDTWEPEDNIHAPELIQQYHQSQNLSIRSTRFRSKPPMISKAHLLDPGVLPTITEPSSVVTDHASPLFAEAIAQVKTQNLVPEVTQKLEAFAQHRLQKPQEVPESREEGSSQIPHLGTNPAHGNPTHCHDPHGELPPQPAPPNQSNHLDNSTAFQRGQHLLRHPVVNRVEDLGGLHRCPMGDTSGGPPDPPWFAKPSASGIPIIMGQDTHGRQFKLPYMRYGLVKNEPLLLETSGRNQQIYGNHLRAFPMLILPFTTNVDDTALEELYMDYPFNWTMNLALYQIGDAGVLADVH